MFFGVGLRSLGLRGVGADFRKGRYRELHHTRSHPPSLRAHHSGDQNGKLRNFWQ